MTINCFIGASILLLLVVRLILFLLSAIGLDVPFLVAVVADKVSVFLLFTGAAFAFALSFDGGDCIEGGGATSPSCFFILDAGYYIARVKQGRITGGKDGGD